MTSEKIKIFSTNNNKKIINGKKEERLGQRGRKG